MSLHLLQTLNLHEDRVWCVAWNPTGTLLASCGGDKMIKIWGQEGEKWVCKSSLQDQHSRTVRSLCWSPCGNFLAAASFDSTVSIWDRRDGEFAYAATLEGHENEVKSVAWSNSGSFLATCGRDKTVWIWEVENEEYECASVLNKHTQDVKAVVWHPNQDVFASCSYDDCISIYKEDDDDWESYDTLVGHTSTVWCLAFNKLGNRLVSGSNDNTLKIWQCYLPNNTEGIVTRGNDPSWKCVCTLSGYHRRTVYSVDWNNDNGIIATASADDSIKLFKEDDNDGVDSKNEPTFSMVANLDGAHFQDVNCVKWNPAKPSILASCSDDMSIKIWSFIE